MACYHPLKARRTKLGLHFIKDEIEAGSEKQKGRDVLALPCGQCVGCRLERAKVWMIRIMHEASQHEESGFLTLTYNDDSLPHGDRPTLDKRDLQLFHKRARKGRAYRYFCAGEYGGQTSRPHYHVITFGWLPEFSSQVTANTWQSDELDEAWSVNGRPLGNATVGQVSAASAAYVSQYVLKKQVGRDEREAGRAREFTTMSNGIGRGWLEKYEKELDRGYIVFEGRKLRIPRYYLEKKGDIDPEWYLLRKLEARAERRAKEFDVQEPRKLANKERAVRASRKFFGSDHEREPDQVRQ